MGAPTAAAVAVELVRDRRHHRHGQQPARVGAVERVRVAGVDVVPEPLEEPPASFDSGARVRRTGHVVVRPEQTDAQSPGVGADLRRERVRGRRRGRRVTGRVAGDAVEDGGGVAHRPRDHVLGHATTPALADVGAEGHAPARRLEPDGSHRAGRVADRTTAVARVREPDDARRHRGRGAAARSADDAVGVPRVARRAERLRLRRGRETELGRVGLAEHHEAGFAEARHERAVVRRDPAVVAEEPRPAVLRRARELRAEVLQEQRDTAERPRADAARRDLLAGAVVQRDDHRVERRVEPLDRVDAGFEQLALGALPRTHQLRLRGRVELGEVDRRAHQDASIRSRPIKFAGPTTRRGPRPARADGPGSAGPARCGRRAAPAGSGRRPRPTRDRY